MVTAIFEIQGMHCDACVKRITKEIQRLQGITNVHVTLEPPRARVESRAPIPEELIAQAVRRAGRYETRRVSVSETSSRRRAPRESYFPLLLILFYLSITVLAIALSTRVWEWRTMMEHFMAGFFLVFSFFKLLDLEGFALAFAQYDLIGSRVRAYALSYPFIELTLGIAYVVRVLPQVTNIVTLGVMTIGSLGVLRSLASRRRIKCACLGTVFNLPMSTVTLVEDLLMAVMAGWMLLH
jgi:copper chaperone CopZ